MFSDLDQLLAVGGFMDLNPTESQRDGMAHFVPKQSSRAKALDAAGAGKLNVKLEAIRPELRAGSPSSPFTSR